MVLHEGLGPARRCGRHLAEPKPAPMVVVVVIMVLLLVLSELVLLEAMPSMLGCWRLPLMPLRALQADRVAGGFICVRLLLAPRTAVSFGPTWSRPEVPMGATFAHLVASASICCCWGSKGHSPR